MVEIGAGGGSIATLDQLKQIAVGPESAGSDPGPACYGRGSAAATVTDADVVLGRIDPGHFAGGKIELAPDLAEDAVDRDIGSSLDLTPVVAAAGIDEIVNENMANAARVHAIAGRLRRRGAPACGAARGQARRGSNNRAPGRRRRIGGRVSDGADLLRSGPDPPR